MTILLRIVLLLVSLLNCAWVLVRIRKAQMKIENSVFWIIFSGILIVMSLFPRLIEIGAKFTGVQSSVNFVFLSIIFVLIIKIFQLSVKLSQIESKLQTLAQNYAIDHKELEEESAEKDKITV